MTAEPAIDDAALPQTAQNNAYTESLRLGSQHFSERNFTQSKAYYELALKQALEQGKPVYSIYYNLGSVCYRLAQYDSSRRYFEELVNHEKLNAVAYYNLALIENRQSDKQAAINYLNRSRQSTSDEKLASLIDRQLLKLNAPEVKKVKKDADKDWHAYLYLSPGYDSNIRFAPLEIASEESGNFLQFYGLFDKRIAGKGSGKKQPALLFTSSVFISNYFSTDFNDYNIYDVGLRYLVPVNKWRNRIDLNIKKSTYGHIDYQRLYVLTFKTRRRFSDGNTLRLRYRYEQIDSLDPLYDYLQGYRQKFRLGYQLKWPMDKVDLWYEYEINDRQNTERRNYSATRNTFRVRYQKSFDARNKVYAELEYRRSDYEPTPFQDRLDNRAGYLLAYVNDIATDWQFLARWGFRNNRSTDSIYTYDRHVALLTIRKGF